MKKYYVSGKYDCVDIVMEVEEFDNLKKMGKDVIIEGELDHRVISFIEEKCKKLGYDEYFARDHDGNKIRSHL